MYVIKTKRKQLDKLTTREIKLHRAALFMYSTKNKELTSFEQVHRANQNKQKAN